MSDTAIDLYAGYTLNLSRQIAAPREAVFKALTDAEALAKWFGPAGVTAKDVSVDLKPGGSYSLEMHNAEGLVNSLSGIYREIVPPARLVFTWVWGMDSMAGIETLVTIDLAENEGGTKLTLIHEGLPRESARDHHQEGWVGCFDCLVEYLS